MEKFTLNKTVFELEKRRYLPHFLSDKGFKGTVVNRALSSLPGGFLKPTLTVPLKIVIIFFLINIFTAFLKF